MSSYRLWQRGATEDEIEALPAQERWRCITLPLTAGPCWWAGPCCRTRGIETRYLRRV